MGGLGFSAVICCGLIEARAEPTRAAPSRWFSAVICCGLIEARGGSGGLGRVSKVFRSDMLRPH